MGNRSLMGRNKAGFLKSAQLERQKREAIRLQNKSATTIQAACRRFVDLLRWRMALSQSWDGQSVVEFKYFFPFLINVQPTESSQCQITKLQSSLGLLADDQLQTAANVLIEAFVKGPNFEKEPQWDLLTGILQCIHEILLINRSITIEVQLRENFTSSLLSLYQNGHTLILYYILIFSPILCFKNLLNLFINPQFNLLDDTLAHAWLKEFVTLENLLCQNCDNRKYVSELSDVSKLNLLLTISKTMTMIGANGDKLDASTFGFIQFFLNSFADNISTIKSSRETGDSAMEVDNLKETSIYSDKSGTHISKDVFKSIQSLYQSYDINILKEYSFSADFYIGYISSLLHFSSLFTDDNGKSLKLCVDLNWILTGNHSNLIISCFNNILSFKEFVGLSQIPKHELSLLVSVEQNKKWWDSLLIFQEFLMNIISFTAAENFFNSICITKEDFFDFVRFLKLFVREVLLKYRDLEQVRRDNFLNVFKKLLTLTHSIYLKDSKLKYFEKDFWISFGFDFELSSIASIIPIIDKFHYSILHDHEYEDADVKNYGFLSSSRLTDSLNVKIPKKIIDSLYILTYAPYMVPFEKRAEIFHAFIEYDKKENDITGWYPTKIEGIISRDNILFDSFNYYGNIKGKDFKKPFSVQFVNQFGEKEAGIDGGGLTKELLTSLVSSVFVPSEENRKLNHGLQFFKEGENHKLYLNPEFYFKLQYEKLHNYQEKITYACSNDEYLQMCRFLGMVIGKCLYDNILLDVSFTSFFLNTCTTMGSKYFQNLIGDEIDVIGPVNSFDELNNLDASLYQSLKYILRQSDEEKFKNMSLEFTADGVFYDMNGRKHYVSIPLLPHEQKGGINGGSLQFEPVSVNSKNKIQFVRMVTQFRLSKQSELLNRSFINGLYEVIKPYWLLLFDPTEIQSLISGDSDEIDLKDLQNNISYGGGYTSQDQTIIDLFEILNEFSNEDRGKFLKFVTSSSKQPLLGFKELNPKFGIFNSGSDFHRLPTASTCVNLLKLPNYRNKEQLRKKILYSINSKAGFDLS